MNGYRPGHIPAPETQTDGSLLSPAEVAALAPHSRRFRSAIPIFNSTGAERGAESPAFSGFPLRGDPTARIDTEVY